MKNKVASPREVYEEINKIRPNPKDNYYEFLKRMMKITNRRPEVIYVICAIPTAKYPPIGKPGDERKPQYLQRTMKAEDIRKEHEKQAKFK